MEDEQSHYGLIVSFPDQSASFVHGFEAGMISERMQSGASAEIEVVTHVENREVIARMGIAYGWEVTSHPSGTTGWDTTILRKSQQAPKRPNPHGLRLVSANEESFDV